MTEQCRNCKANLPDRAKFCPACGQKNTDGRLTFGELLAHLVENLFSLDARIFQTLGALAIPGKLTESFFRGKHIRYYHPVRLFVFATALLIATISLIFTSEEREKVDNFWKKQEYQHQQNVFLDKLDSVSNSVAFALPDGTNTESLDSLLQKMRSIPRQSVDSLEIATSINFDSTSGSTKIAVSDLVTMPTDSLALKYGTVGFWQRLALEQNLRIIRSPSTFATYLIGNTLWMALFMMPLLALVLKLVYIRRRFLYYEHLVFSFHVHTFIFLVSVILSLIAFYFHQEWTAFAFLFVGFYPMLAMKRFYKEKWLSTIFKFLITGILYLLVLSLVILIGSATSLFLF